MGEANFDSGLIAHAKTRLARALDLLETNIREKFELLMHDNHKEVSLLLQQVDDLSSKLDKSKSEADDLKLQMKKNNKEATLGKIDKTISALEEILEVKNSGGKIGNS